LRSRADARQPSPGRYGAIVQKFGLWLPATGFWSGFVLVELPGLADPLEVLAVRAVRQRSEVRAGPKDRFRQQLVGVPLTLALPDDVGDLATRTCHEAERQRGRRRPR